MRFSQGRATRRESRVSVKPLNANKSLLQHAKHWRQDWTQSTCWLTVSHTVAHIAGCTGTQMGAWCVGTDGVSGAPMTASRALVCIWSDHSTAKSGNREMATVRTGDFSACYWSMHLHPVSLCAGRLQGIHWIRRSYNYNEDTVMHAPPDGGGISVSISLLSHYIRVMCDITMV